MLHVIQCSNTSSVNCVTVASWNSRNKSLSIKISPTTRVCSVNHIIFHPSQIWTCYKTVHVLCSISIRMRRNHKLYEPLKIWKGRKSAIEFALCKEVKKSWQPTNKVRWNICCFRTTSHGIIPFLQMIINSWFFVLNICCFLKYNIDHSEHTQRDRSRCACHVTFSSVRSA